MMQNLYSEKTRERTDAALSLAKCGSKAKDAVPRLAEMLYDKNVGVQSSASYALRQIDTPAARAIMKQVEQDRELKR